jgi:uncharacterized protein YwgA
MRLEKFRYLAGVIAAHPNRQVVGRTRLQKTVKLLQRLGFPTDYGYMSFFYGPYSEGVQFDIGLLEHFGLVKEERRQGSEKPYYVMTAVESAKLPELKKFQKFIDILSDTDATVLELAATYDSYRERGDDHDIALERVRRKKGSKCDEGRLDSALQLLRTLGLSAE